MINYSHKKIAPSILSSKLTHLHEEISKIELAKADWIHIDVMDGHFVPNLTFGPKVVRDLKKITHLPLDVHLMVTNPESHIESFFQAGASCLTAHLEVLKNPIDYIKKVKKLGILAGLSIKPNTPIEDLYPYLKDLDLVLVMLVEPGFSGQKLIQTCVQKVSKVADEILRQKVQTQIEVDGGVNADVVHFVSRADIFVSGHYIFKHSSYKEAISTLRSRVQK